MANPALTEHVFNAPVPEEHQYDFNNAEDVAAFEVKNEAFQKL